jgi:NAD(P)-dependent dehydrogenase (short-subunit alcohol dehydrogenase family)
MPFHASIAAKAGVEGLVKSLGAELASTVRVNAIAPTITETTLAANILRNDRMKDMVERHPMKSYFNHILLPQKSQINLRSNFEMDYGIVSFK